MAHVMKAVRSGICTHVGYDPDTKELRLRHENERVSVFSNVPVAVGEAVENAESIGKAYHSMIKGQPEYPHRYE